MTQSSKPAYSQLAFTILAGLPLLGVIGGGAIPLLSPPENSIDFWPDVFGLAFAFGMIGLFLGFLAWLWLRKRITWFMAVAVLAIPVCAFGWFICGKGGKWNFAWLFGIVGVLALVTFLILSLQSIALDHDVE